MPHSGVVGQIVDCGMEIMGLEKEQLDCLQLRSVRNGLPFCFLQGQREL